MPVIVATRVSPCTVCRLTVMVGERIHFTRSTGAQHLACFDELDDPEEVIVVAYMTHRMAPVSYDDQRAFDACVTEFGYVETVKALYGVSPLAKQKEDAYQARRVNNHNRIASRGVNDSSG